MLLGRPFRPLVPKQALHALAGELKRACGTGGTVVDNTVELQGDVRERVRPLLAKKGWTIKG